jgi:uncharacterized protein (DUF433 family)
LATEGKTVASLDISNVVAAFSEEHVQRLTSLSLGRLRYWDRSGFFKPSYAEENPRLAYSRFYSFKDIVALRTIEMLRVQNGVPLQHLRKVAEKLAHLKDDLWTKTTLYVVNKRVVLVNPETGIPQEVVTGQYLLGIPLTRVISDTSDDIRRMQHRSDQQIGRVSRSRAIAHNSWVVAGTRIPIGSIQRLHEDGYTTDQIIAEYPDLKAEDVEAALKHKSTKAA